ncbi:hypothetical protein IPM62_00370 [Candidatus Woesebacteria bacterium]|nr:MAG: hypothetical protein IPM62_00370 [Candidatus Woesebacteria bacterium]
MIKKIKYLLIVAAVLSTGILLYILFNDNSADIDIDNSSVVVNKLDIIDGNKSLTHLNNIAGQLIGINTNNGKLVRITNNETSILFEKVVEKYSQDGRYILVKEHNNASSLTLIDTSTNLTSIIQLTKYSPIVSATISEQEGKIYFIGNYNPNTEKSILYSLPINSNSPISLLETTASDVDCIVKNRLVLFEDYDSPNASKVSILDLLTLENTVLSLGNTYSLTPDKAKIAIQSSSNLTIYDLNDMAIMGNSQIRPGNKTIWINNSQIFILTNLPNTTYAILDVSNMSLSEQKPIENIGYIREISAYINGIMYMVDYNDNLYSVEL